MKKIIYLMVLLFCSKNIYCQNIIENLDMFLSHKYLNSGNDLYVYFEISIWNRNAESIFVLKNYDIVDVIEEEDGIIFILSSWVDKLDFLKYTSAMYHNPSMIEFRNMQRVYLPLLLKIPENNANIDQNKIIKEIRRLKYSLNEHITEDIVLASNVDEFADEIREKVNDLTFIYNMYNRKYGNIIVSQIKPPEWLIGTWITDGLAVLDGNTEIMTTTRNLRFVYDDFFTTNLGSIHGWLITRAENTIIQNYTENSYHLYIYFANGRVDYYHFTMENSNLIMEQRNQNGLWRIIFIKE
jgi:hypothetical protein